MDFKGNLALKSTTEKNVSGDIRRTWWNSDTWRQSDTQDMNLWEDNTDCENVNKTRNASNVNTETRSRNHYWRGRGITYSECTSVALVIQHAGGMGAVLTCGLSGPTIFFHINSQTARFSFLFFGGGELFLTKCAFWFCLQHLSETLLILRRVQRDITTVYTGLFKMIVGVLTTCHTQYTWDRSICIFLFNRTTLQVFVTYLTGALYAHPFVILQTPTRKSSSFQTVGSMSAVRRHLSKLRSKRRNA